MAAGPYRGGCLCGRVRFEIDPPTRFCAHCHCSQCRRAHGSAYVTWVGVPDAAFRIVRGEDDLARFETETGATRSFCRICGSTMLYRGPRWPDEVHVARALIEGEIDRAPAAHVYVDHKATWHDLAEDGLPRRGGESGMEPR